MIESKVFEVDYERTDSQSDYPLREQLKDAGFQQGDDVRIHIDDGLIVVRGVDDD